MADYISGIKHITPAYPVKPVQPVHKDRETDRRKTPHDERREKGDKEQHNDEDGEQQEEEKPQYATIADMQAMIEAQGKQMQDTLTTLLTPSASISTDGSANRVCLMKGSWNLP